MSDNLVFLLNKLSYVIVAQNFETCGGDCTAKKDECYFNKCLKKVRQTGCDVLLKKTSGTTIQDPCLTDYGGNWSPITLITDYGRELQAQGAGRYSDLLLNCIKILEDKPYDGVSEILKFLLLLKKPLIKESSEYFQKELPFSGSDSVLNAIDSDTFLLEDCPRDSLSKTSSHKKALKYEESWTKQFDPKFQLLGEYSKKNMLTPDKVSLNSLFPSRPLVNTTQSRSNSFVFPDFSSARNYRSEKSLFDINSNTYLTDSTFLDNFVDHPIAHKLPALLLNPKFSRGGLSGKSSLHIKTRFPSFPEEGHATEGSEPCSNLDSKKPSVIELKRNSNCCHSFAILYEKSGKSHGSSSGSNESLSYLKGKRKGKSVARLSSSGDVIMALWEQEQNLIREFKPELAVDFPELRMITHSEYVEDVKYLFTGINSKTFKYDAEKNMFNMVYGTCLDDVTPESLFDFSKEFLEIGNCYVKLISCVGEIGKNNFDTCTSISQAFWKSIFDFLELHYSLVLDIPFTVNLIALKSCTKDLHEIITTIARICRVFKPEEPLPKGGELITYLLDYAEKISKQCVINVVFGILQNCCSVYFLCVLQNWMFKGHLENQGDEFFVDTRRNKIKTKSRAYYNSFYLIDERIPSFLRGFEENIYNCGKSIHFLKLFNAENKFCQLLEKADYPSMYVCFSEEQLVKLEEEFGKYERRVIETCGERITIKTIKEEEKEKERAYMEYIRECKVEQEEKRELERMKRLEEAKAVKDRQNKLLNEQLSSIAAEKERRKKEEEAQRLQLEEEMKRSETQRANIINQEKSLMKSYYDQLLGNLNKELKVLEKRKECLKKILIGETNDADLDDVNDINDINDNSVITDGEGNVTSKSDENSNADMTASEKLVRSVGLESEATDTESVLGSGVVVFDENSNPRVTNEVISSDSNANSVDVENMAESEPEKVVRKSVSLRTVAAEEAERNKCKILRSEFGLPVRQSCAPMQTPETLETNSVALLSDLERNRRKVLESEYNLLKPVGRQMSVRSVPRRLQIVKENAFSGKPLKLSSDSIDSSDFHSVALERKSECLNLGSPAPKTVTDGSSDSFLASSTEPSAENFSNVCEDNDSVRTHASNSVLLNEKYQDALTLDMNVFYHKVSHRHIFCSLKDGDLEEDLPCTDFMKFQRCLRKSALIPLKIQEKLANDALLKHLLKGENLLSHLRSLRGYFFLNDGEFGRSFTHHTFRSLARCTEPKQFFERSNLSNIVNEALNYTIHNCEPNSQNLSFRIVKMPPFLNHSSHDVLSPFELSYKVDWPLNIILTEKALSKYKMVFRFLLKLKRINWTLNENFLYLNSQFKRKRLKDEDLTGSPHYHKIQIYRHAMTQVMITLDDYIFSNGVQLPWIYFLKDLETTENIDHLYQKHVRYIKDVLTRCFLSKNSEDLLECIHSMIELALKFHYTARSSVLNVVDGRYEHPKFSVLKATFEEFCSVIKTFLRTLKEKISANQVLKSHYILIEKFDLKLT